MNDAFDVAIVGGGIVGLAHAWAAARRRQRVLLVERSPWAQGASIRNFGMIWPIGQPAGPLRATALRSRALWLELAERGVVEVERCGSLHLAHRADELDVLEEFRGLRDHEVTMLSPAEIVSLAPLANPEGLLGALRSDTELRVNPRVASASIAKWLAESQGVSVEFNTAIVEAGNGVLVASDGRRWKADTTVVCSGSDLQTLFPEVLGTAGLRLCKLQMLKATAPSARPGPSPHLASGLTLRHYTSFLGCPSLARLKARVAAESPELDRYGIHVMASHFANGDVILGDSHEYDEDISPFDKPEIDDLMLRELRRVIRLPDWTVTERWHGVYAKHSDLPIVEASPAAGVRICVGPGGAGMTMSFGLADEAWNRWKGACG